MNKSVQRWLRSKYAVSWQLAVALLLNYPITGFFFGETLVSESGFTNHALNLVTGLTCCVLILLFSLLRNRRKTESILFVQFIFLCSSVSAIALSNAINDAVGFEPNELVTLISGLVQMYAIHNLYAFVIASLIETRNERKQLEIQQSKLAALQTNLQKQIDEISSRIKSVVSTKLESILDGLKSSLNKNLLAQPQVLADEIRDALNEGVRPLSWSIENEDRTFVEDFEYKKNRIGLIERFKFQIQMNHVVSIRLLFAAFMFFDLPVMILYFGTNAAIETLVTIVLTSLMLLGVKRLAGDRMFASWFATLVISVTVAIGSSTFILYRQITGELSADAAEVSLVFSMVQISVICAIFQSSLFRRYTYIENQRLVNRHLEELVSQLRQSAWVAKRKLARLVHGQVQSDLFAAYLQLSQATEPDSALYKEVSERISQAQGALALPDSAGQDFEATLGQIVDTWGSSFKVDTDISGKALAALKSDPVATSCALEIILEAVNNAAKHGNSDRALLHISLKDHSHLYIEVTNNAEASKDLVAGFGSKILDEITHDWNFEISNGVAKLTAEIILSKN